MAALPGPSQYISPLIYAGLPYKPYNVHGAAASSYTLARTARTGETRRTSTHRPFDSHRAKTFPFSSFQNFACVRELHASKKFDSSREKQLLGGAEICKKARFGSLNQTTSTKLAFTEQTLFSPQ